MTNQPIEERATGTQGQIYTGPPGTFEALGFPKDQGKLWVRITAPPKGKMAIDGNGLIYNKIELGNGITLYHVPPDAQARAMLGKALEGNMQSGYLFGLQTAMMPRTPEMSANASGTTFLADVAGAASNAKTSVGEPLDSAAGIFTRNQNLLGMDLTGVLIGIGLLIGALALALGWKAGK